MKRSYPYTHWLSTLIVAPFVPTFANLIYQTKNDLVVSLLDVYPVTFLFSLFYSVPTFVVYYIAFYFLSRSHPQIILAKIILIGIAVLGITITQLLIKGSMSFTIVYSFSIAAIICGLLWKLDDKKSSEEKLESKRVF